MTASNDSKVFPKGDKTPADYFTGTVWLKILVPNNPTLNCQIANVVFKPGARNNWHTHLAISTNPEKGIVVWMEKVSDDEYNRIKL